VVSLWVRTDCFNGLLDFGRESVGGFAALFKIPICRLVVLDFGGGQEPQFTHAS
jgi:hypothetical protein